VAAEAVVDQLPAGTADRDDGHVHGVCADTARQPRPAYLEATDSKPGEPIVMNAQRITTIAAVLALATAPAAFAGTPKGSHGQETDTHGATQISARCGVASTTVFSASQAVFAAPRGSHGQETDRPTGSQPTLRLACISRSATLVAARSTVVKVTPKGSHGQETDQPRR
jgi:hypothetical protein